MHHCSTSSLVKNQPIADGSASIWSFSSTIVLPGNQNRHISRRSCVDGCSRNGGEGDRRTNGVWDEERATCAGSEEEKNLSPCQKVCSCRRREWVLENPFVVLKLFHIPLPVPPTKVQSFVRPPLQRVWALRTNLLTWIRAKAGAASSLFQEGGSQTFIALCWILEDSWWFSGLADDWETSRTYVVVLGGLKTTWAVIQGQW